MTTLLQKQLANLLVSRKAHLALLDVLEQVPQEVRNCSIAGVPYTIWQLLEHMRLAQKDILEYIVDPNYQPGTFPDDYWPATNARMDWNRTVKEYTRDSKQLQKLIKEHDPLGSLPYGEKGHTYLREILMLADHQAYHLGQLVLLLRLVGAWD